MSPDQLIRVEGQCFTARAAAPSLARLLAASRADGVFLHSDSCYRPYERQVGSRGDACSKGRCACAGRPGGSMHGWGKAIDFRDARGSIRSTSSAGYRWLKAYGGRYGWNHPGWAEPGGGPCPEPWHWEWVGDGGTLGADPIRADIACLVPTRGGAGYWMMTGLGDVISRGDARPHGSAGHIPLSRIVIGAAGASNGRGYWLVAADGGVFAFGDAPFLGSRAGGSGRPIVGVTATPSGRGYWLVASDGAISHFGDAASLGSAASMPLNLPIVGMAGTPSGRGYWLVAADGGVFAFGDAPFLGTG